jgi:hypothetical protein
MAARSAASRILGEFGIWAGLAGVAYGLSFEFANEPGTYLWGAASWPRGIALLMVIGAIVQAAMRWYAEIAAPQASTGIAAVEVRTAGIESETANRLAMFANFALPLLYVFLLPRTGFYVTTPLFLTAYLALLGERRAKVLILAPLVIFVLVNLVFTRLFYVALPTGNWPGFYDASNWFLVTVR